MFYSTHVFFAAFAFALALTYAHPTPDLQAHPPSTPDSAAVATEDGRIKKRSAGQPTTEEEIAALKELLLESVAAQMAANLPPASLGGRGGEPESVRGGAGEGEEVEGGKRKRMYAPLSGLPGELPTIKRQIRYHQCYFNPISCFRRK